MITSAALAARALERFGDELYHCASCNYCVDQVWPERGIARVCATLEHHAPSPAYSGRGFIEIARALAEGVELDLATVAARVNTCTGCGNCEMVCPIGLHPAAIGRALREALYDAGAAPAAVATAVHDITTQGGARPAPCLVVPTARPGAPRLVLFAGCHADDDAALLLPWLAQAGIDVELVGRGEHCCGAALAELGAARMALAWRQRALACLGADAVVLGYECLGALADDATSMPTGFLAWLVARLDAGELALALRGGAPPAPVHLLESCQLKPRPGRPVLPDEQLAGALFTRLGVVLAEPRFPNPYRLCCGAGGGLPRLEPDAARRMAAARLDAVGEATAVTLDPRCAHHLATSSAHGVTSLVSWLTQHCALTVTGGGAP